MNVLYVYAHHEDPASLNAVLRAGAVSLLGSMGHAVAASDLYPMGFKPVLDERDFTDRALPDRFVPNIEIRHALDRSPVPQDVAAELEKLRAADLVVLQFPLWWSSVPAILKGWLDRVLSFAHAADTEGLSRAPFVRGKRAMLVTTLEAPEEASPGGGVREMLAPLSAGTLEHAGMTVFPPFIVYGATPDRDADWVAAQLERLRAHLVLTLTGL